MKQILQTVWWWIRVVLLVVVALYALALLAFNSGQRADVWYWPGRPAENTSIIALVLASFIAGGLVCTIGFALFSAWVKYRRSAEARRKRLEHEHRAELKRKASMLRTKPAPQPAVRGPKIVPAVAPPAAVVVPEPLPSSEPEIVAMPAAIETSPEPVEPRKPVEPVEPHAPISVDAHRATPFGSQPIAPGRVPPASTGLPIAEPDVIDPPTDPEA